MNNLESKLDDQFFGVVVRQKLNEGDNFQEKELFLKGAVSFITEFLNYVKKRFSLETINLNYFKFLSWRSVPSLMTLQM